MVQGSTRGAPPGSAAEAPWPISESTTRLWSWCRRTARRSHPRLRERECIMGTSGEGFCQADESAGSDGGEDQGAEEAFMGMPRNNWLRQSWTPSLPCERFSFQRSESRQSSCVKTVIVRIRRQAKITHNSPRGRQRVNVRKDHATHRHLPKRGDSRSPVAPRRKREPPRTAPRLLLAASR